MAWQPSNDSERRRRKTVWGNAAALGRQILSELYRGYDKWITGAALLLALASLVDARVERVLAGGLSWIGVIPLVLVMGLAVLRAHHVTVDDEAARADRADQTSDGLASELERLRTERPRILFGDPSVAVVGRVVQQDSAFYAFGQASNHQYAPGRGVAADDAIPYLQVYAMDERPLFLGTGIRGRWRDAPSVLERSPLQHHTDKATLSLPPNGDPRQFDLAVRGPGEAWFSIIDAEQQAHPIQEGTVRVVVRIHCSNADPNESAVVYLVALDDLNGLHVSRDWESKWAVQPD